MLPLIPIVAAAWVVFWMHPKEFSSQISVGITAMLTVVAYRISIDSSLPPLNYMTRMDYFLLACQVFVFGAFIIVVGIHVLYVINTSQTRAVAHRLTVQCRWLPAVLLAGASVLLSVAAGELRGLDHGRRRAAVRGLDPAVAQASADLLGRDRSSRAADAARRGGRSRGGALSTAKPLPTARPAPATLSAHGGIPEPHVMPGQSVRIRSSREAAAA